MFETSSCACPQVGLLVSELPPSQLGPVTMALAALKRPPNDQLLTSLYQSAWRQAAQLTAADVAMLLEAADALAYRLPEQVRATACPS